MKMMSTLQFLKKHMKDYIKQPFYSMDISDLFKNDFDLLHFYTTQEQYNISKRILTTRLRYYGLSYIYQFHEPCTAVTLDYLKQAPEVERKKIASILVKAFEDLRIYQLDEKYWNSIILENIVLTNDRNYKYLLLTPQCITERFMNSTKYSLRQFLTLLLNLTDFSQFEPNNSASILNVDGLDLINLARLVPEMHVAPAYDELVLIELEDQSISKKESTNQL